MCFTDIFDTNLILVAALVKSLRVSIGRVKVITNPHVLYKLKNESNNSYSNKPTYIYDIVLGPDPTNDIVTPYTTIKNFA